MYGSTPLPTIRHGREHASWCMIHCRFDHPFPGASIHAIRSGRLREGASTLISIIQPVWHSIEMLGSRLFVNYFRSESELTWLLHLPIRRMLGAVEHPWPSKLLLASRGRSGAAWGSNAANGLCPYCGQCGVHCAGSGHALANSFIYHIVRSAGSEERGTRKKVPRARRCFDEPVLQYRF